MEQLSTNTIFSPPLGESEGTSMLIYNAHIISPQVNIACGAVLVEKGIIKNVFKSCEVLPKADETIDANGHFLMPGFIDIHTHGAGGCDVCDGSLEAIETISRLKLEEGTTTFCPTTLTLSYEQLEKALKMIAIYKEKEQYAKIAGVHLEGPFVSQLFIGAQNPDFARLPDLTEIKKLHAITPIVIVTYAPELENGLNFTKGLTELGIVASAGHSAASYSCIREAEKSGLKHLTHFCNQMSPLHHREIGIVGAGLMDDDLLIEVICDKIHLSTDMLRLVFQLKNKDKIAVITDSLAATGLEDGEYELGGLPIYVKHNAARLKHNNHLAGSTLRMNIALKNIAEATGLPLETLIQTTSYNQAKSLGIRNLGKIENGFIADFVILNNNFEVQKVIKDGI